MDIIDVIPPQGATGMQKLQCATVNFFNTNEAANLDTPTNFKLNNHIAISELEFWEINDHPSYIKLLRKLGFENNRNESLKFTVLTSSALSNAAKALMVIVDAHVRNEAIGVITANREILSFRVMITWIPEPGLPLPDWKMVLQLIRAVLAHTHGREGGRHSFEHSDLGEIEVTRRKGMTTWADDDGESF